jgi:monovalent cation/proton antiporter MnhG/PhaG subunit
MLIEAILQAVTAVLVAVGLFFFLVGTVGVLRLPDFYSRTHAATKCDTLGAGSILLGLAVLGASRGEYTDGLKVLVIAVLVLLSSPTAAHALARAAFRTGLEPYTLPEARGGEDT